jgi:hypothetical protein
MTKITEYVDYHNIFCFSLKKYSQTIYDFVKWYLKYLTSYSPIYYINLVDTDGKIFYKFTYRLSGLDYLEDAVYNACLEAYSEIICYLKEYKYKSNPKDGIITMFITKKFIKKSKINHKKFLGGKGSVHIFLRDLRIKSELWT